MTDFPRDKSPCFHRWTYTVEQDETAFVLPDGCTDVLVTSYEKTERNIVRITSWDLSPTPVKLFEGTTLTGFRLRPGTTVNPSDFNIDVHDLALLEAEIGHIARQDQDITEIIDALGLPGSSVDKMARQQGVSERTLQRHFKGLSLPPPGFWRQLGRARRAVQALPCRVPLSAIALEYGYSDQAHMTRKFVRWFGKTPVQLRRNPTALVDLAQPGLGNWSS